MRENENERENNEKSVCLWRGVRKWFPYVVPSLSPAFCSGFNQSEGGMPRVPVAQWLEHCVSSAKVVGSIAREHAYCMI